METDVATTPLSCEVPDAVPPRLHPIRDASAPLTAEHFEQLAQAKLRAKKVRRAATLAIVNVWLLGAFAIGSLLIAAAGALFGEIDIVGLVMAAGLGLVAWNEHRGRAMLLCMRPRGCRVLGWNQLGLMVLVIGYAAWMLAQALWAPSPYADVMAREPMLVGSLGSLDRWYRMLSLAIYGGLIVGTALFQGLNAAYYFTRRKHVVAYLRDTPEWVVQLQRRGVSV